MKQIWSLCLAKNILSIHFIQRFTVKLQENIQYKILKLTSRLPENGLHDIIHIKQASHGQESCETFWACFYNYAHVDVILLIHTLCWQFAQLVAQLFC